MPALDSPLDPATEIALRGRLKPEYGAIFTSDALRFLAELHQRFDGRRRELLAARAARQARFDAGETPDFLPETAEIRAGAWKIADTPPALVDRRVEITGPVDRKMIINALNSGARVFMADFEDATSPTWDNLVDGQVNLYDWARERLDYADPKSGKTYALQAKTATLIVRPRGWHLEERHVDVAGRPMSGALVDFGLFFFHNARTLHGDGRGPYFYLPKLESHLEARLWNDVFNFAQDYVGLPRGSIKATVLIETLPAAFEMDEILFELKDHIVGLNCGRWDYIFSFIKTFRNRPEYLLPDRSDVVMGAAFLKAYSELLIKTCHRRGAHAMGGMAAAIPDRKDPEANEKAMAAVRADKEREAKAGHDGSWVAHPDLVSVATEVFDRLMPGPNQIDNLREDVSAGQAALLEVHKGTRTESGLRNAIRVGVQYIAAWLCGRGAVPLENLMEDAATAEICRAQIWQWIKFRAELSDGRKVSAELFDDLLSDEMTKLREIHGEAAMSDGRLEEAAGLFRELSLADEFEAFLTIPAYARLVDIR